MEPGPGDPDDRPDHGRTRRDVRRTYDRIADHFAKTRPEPWGEVESFLRDRTGELGLDVGVGNGRHAELLADVCEAVVGIDASLLALGTAADRARERGFAVDLALGDAATLPLRSGAVDIAVYVATLHHLPTRALRVASLDELGRVLAPGGEAIVSAWSVSHDRFEAEAGFDTTVDWTLPDGRVVERFYHIYDFDEFLGDVGASALSRRRSFETSGNCYAVVGPEQ